ncbi:CHRD domain-containing protein [Roseateles violae]|uniref:CHRD domain-containing protein n=1 Tax=Roseateles violae TaxID=3058042 RepID=A0ABT8DLQ2_9BURK|nr:CHRD domain-containing protein [Pelomonas sp. PFR6]MDN3918906.1 CHRD domain-containing protein [Pelomonas sp. PFR6]
MRQLPLALALATLLAAPLAAQATVYQFTATLSPANEVGPPPASTATGLALLAYDDKGTASLADDSYDFTLAVFGLASAPTGYHIHGAATAAENAPVRIAIDSDPAFSKNFSGATLMVSGNDVTPPALIPATPSSPTNAGHPAMSFLDMLQGGLAYVNVHTAAAPAGATRGQLTAVQAVPVPEPSSYAMLLAGLGLVGLLARRRR